MHRTSDYDYRLPPEQIAQAPRAERDSARMMVLNRETGAILAHARVADLPDFLRPGDLLVRNDSRVFPARVQGRWRDTGGGAELLLVERLPGTQRWSALCGSGRPLRPGLELRPAGADLFVRIRTGRDARGRVQVEFPGGVDVMALLERIGTPPVPPYIRRNAEDPRIRLDRTRYQTVYARQTGSVAAPTAGLHFTEALLDKLGTRGIGMAEVTLHVGPGTFRPVKTERVEEHEVEPERYSVPEATARKIRACRDRGGRVVAVGSTTVRTLETMMAGQGAAPRACSGRSGLYIYPPFAFRAVDIMLTNFHLPRSSLLMMVCALAGRDRVLRAYAEAVRRGYRFYSYGDCMLILPGTSGDGS